MSGDQFMRISAAEREDYIDLKLGPQKVRQGVGVIACDAPLTGRITSSHCVALPRAHALRLGFTEVASVLCTCVHSGCRPLHMLLRGHADVVLSLSIWGNLDATHSCSM